MIMMMILLVFGVVVVPVAFDVPVAVAVFWC